MPGISVPIITINLHKYNCYTILEIRLVFARLGGQSVMDACMVTLIANTVVDKQKYRGGDLRGLWL